VNENSDVDDDDHAFTSLDNRDWFGQNQSWKNVSFGWGGTLARKRSSICFYIQNKVCSLIIDRGSYANIASTTLVSKLNLYMIKHNRPYML